MALSYPLLLFGVSLLNLRIGFSAIVLVKHPTDRGRRPITSAVGKAQVWQFTCAIWYDSEWYACVIRLPESVLGRRGDHTVPQRHLVQFLEVAWVPALDARMPVEVPTRNSFLKH